MRESMVAGEQFGRLVTLSREGTGPGKKPLWLCSCSCGQTTIVRASDLRTGNTVSCGCLLTEARVRDRKHGGARRGARTPEYKIYRGMIRRCYDEATVYYHRYGGRGIKVCDRWRSNFKNFLEDIGLRPSARHSLDRYPNNDGNYEPGNCRWTTMVEQQNNRGNNRLVIFDGETLTVAQLGRRAVVALPTLRKRLDAGWTVADAISLPASRTAPQRTATRRIERRT